MSVEKKYKTTIESYRRLGKKYIDAIRNIKIPELGEFVLMLPDKAKILDVGCAGGRDSKIFCEKGFGVTGIDIIDSFIKEAKIRVPNARFKRMDLRKLSFADNSFDAIWALAVLLHFNKSTVLKILKSFRRILKPDGKLYLRVKQGKGSNFVSEKLTSGQKRFFAYFTKSEFENMVKKSGFKIIKSRLIPDESQRRVVWISIFAQK